MSRWLRSVNHLLEKLDDHVESAESARSTLMPPGISLSGLGRPSASTTTRQGDMSSDDDDDDDYDNDEDDDEDVEEEGESGESYRETTTDDDDDDDDDQEYEADDVDVENNANDLPEEEEEKRYPRTRYYDDDDDDDDDNEEIIELEPMKEEEEAMGKGLTAATTMAPLFDQSKSSSGPSSLPRPDEVAAQQHQEEQGRGDGRGGSGASSYLPGKLAATTSEEFKVVDPAEQQKNKTTPTSMSRLISSNPGAEGDEEELTTKSALVPPESLVAPTLKPQQQQQQQQHPAAARITTTTSTGVEGHTKAPPPPQALAPHQRPPTAPSSANSSIGAGSRTATGSTGGVGATSASAAAALKRDYKKALQEIQRLEKLNGSLQTQLTTALAEVQAQSDELVRAGQSMEEERKRADEEREDLLEDHEEELMQLKERHQQEIQEYQNRLQDEELKRQQEGGDWTKELQDALSRERTSLQRINELENSKSELQRRVVELENQQKTLENKVTVLTENCRTASERERQAETKLDASMLAHQHQLAQRQARESELERTIAELGAALSSAQLKTSAAAGSNNTPNSRLLGRTGEETGEGSYQAKYQVAMEELEATKTQLSLTTQQCETLQRELQTLIEGHTIEMATAHERQRERDVELAEITAKVKRLEATIRDADQRVTKVDGSSVMGVGSPTGNANGPEIVIAQLTNELTQTRRQVSSLSDQLMRQQGLVETSKSEILTLKGRLQSAVDRAHAAENKVAELATLTSPADMNRIYDLEGAFTTTPSTASKAVGRRRVKGGSRYSQLPSRSMLSALGLRPGGSTEQLAVTIDAVDTWMLETGNILRHEPLARLGFALYFAIIHLFCFTLITFHTIESERADLRTLSDRQHHQ